MTSKLPPHDVQAERRLLGCQLLEAHTIDQVRDIAQPSDFYVDTHATIQRALIKLRDSGADVDVALVAEQLQSTGDYDDVGGTHYLDEIMGSVPYTAHVKSYAKQVAKFARRRRQISIAQKLIESAYDVTADDVEAAEKAIQAATDLADITPASSVLRPISECVTELIDSMEQGTRLASKVMIPAVDEITGGACPGEMFVIGARPSHGKSLFALQSMDCAAANNWPGLIISEEMAALSLATRMLSTITALPSEQWLGESRRLKFDAREHFKNRANVYIAEKCATATGAERAITSAVRQFGIRIVAVDYAQLLKGSGDSEQERIGDVSQRMKAIAMKHDLVVLLLAQLNRNIELRDNPEPGLADLRGSGSLEQDADVVLFPFWPFKLNESYEDKLEYRIYQRKNRSRGIPTSVLGMRINPQRQRLDPTTGDDFGEPLPEWRG